MSAATASVAKAAAAQKAPATKAPVPGLSAANLAKATKLRTEGDGMTFAEIATSLGVDSRAVSLALAGVARAKKASAAPRAPHERVLTSTLDWPGYVKTLKGCEDAVVAWERSTYCLIRADKTRTGVQQGVVIPATKTPWATVCHHGTVAGAAKGGTAESQGKDGRTFCKKCVAGEDGSVPTRIKPEGEAKSATVKAKAASAKTPVDKAKADLIATARQGGAAAVKEVKAAEAKARAKAAPKPQAPAADAPPAGDELESIA